ncbi:LOW QUALITY PROTEIN: annexin A6 [Mobula birostris]|uniref:LOW QUALITY PROTEIN: annexin A6 n=1 Tax=Mobula birostris TaxID=1983395 RepID=UPI003B2861D5
MSAVVKGGRAGYRGSVKASQNFSANQDAEILYNAMKGIGSDKETIIDLLTSRSNAQRQQIYTSYKTLYGRDLIEDLKYELTGKFERLIVGLMKAPAEYEAKELRDAIQGLGTDEKCVIEVLASRNNKQIHALTSAYKEVYESDLETDVVGDTSGHFKKMLVVLLQGTREEDDVVSEDLVAQDAKELYEAGELQWGTEESTFITILGSRSFCHLRLVFDEYQNIAGKEIEDSLRDELSGDFQKLMLTVVRCARNKPEYFASRLFKAMKGMGTRDNTLIRIMVSRSEIDMLDIREEFRKKYEKSLHSMIRSDTSGVYKRALLRLCGGDDDVAGEFFPEAAQVAYQTWELSATARVEHLNTELIPQPAGSFANREEGDADLARAAEDAKELCSSSDEESASMESKFVSILCTRSYAHLRRVFQDYIKLTNRDIEQAIKTEMSGDLMYGLIAVVRSIKNKPSFFAERLYKSMKGAGTDDRTLTRIMISRSEIDLMNIRQEFKEMYDASLHSFIESDTSGDYSSVLLALCGGED